MAAPKGAARASRVGALGFTALALILTIITSLLLSQLFDGAKSASGPVRPVVVAAIDIPASARINEDHLKVVQWPEASVPEGAYSSLDEILGPNPRVPVTTVFKGEPILKPRLSSPNQGTGMASKIVKGFRGYSVPVDSWVTQARLVYPGAMVDILTTIASRREQRTFTKLVLQQVPVLAVDGALDAAAMTKAQEAKKTSTNKSVVTVLVTPEQAEILALASREGKIDMVLRNVQDDGLVETEGVDPFILLGRADPDAVEEAEKESQAQVKAAADKPRTRRRRRRGRRRLRTRPGQRSGSEGSNNLGGGTKTINLGGN